MSKGLEALQDIKSKPFSWEKLKDSLGFIEKELKALEITKNKRVIVGRLIFSKDLWEYNNYVSYDMELTQEEYELLREVLL